MIEQRTPGWFEQRKGRVTGSVVGGILGLSPYMTRADVLRSMVRASLGAPSEFTGNVATEWGTYNEAGAIQEFEMETSERVTAMPFVEYEDWLGASPDGSVSDGKGLEVKCPYGIRNDPNPIFKMAQELPHYMAQCQVEMFCVGWQSLWFYQWTPHGTCNKLIHRDDDWLATNIPRLRQFHCEFLDQLANNADEHLTDKRITIDTPEAAKMVQEFDQLTEALERAGERRKELLAEMVAMSGEKNAVFGGRKLTLTTRSGAVSYAKAIKELAPDADIAKWTGKPSSFWGLK